ncbi:PspA/IM30 family protein [Ancylobacter polymorphus]|uniref:Uncharacterized protein n=1 Tax=Ancylobacter polymorphus TaxID=223390 RepID=A0ABU0B982_9HYPH|nr:hypothetical protein [Ancylobacter polymorphus]MDQ0301931.1 hypothetical protein [Ancylobacter polymorphus]
MLSFATEFPVPSEGVESIFLATIKKWIIESPHTAFTESDIAHVGLGDEFNVQVGSQILSSISVSNNNEVTLASKLVAEDRDIEWTTSIVLHKNGEECWIGVRTSREARNATVSLPMAKKPVIVRLILDALGGANDGDLAVQGVPRFLTNNEIALAAQIVLGSIETRLPVVYVSVSFNGRPAVDPSTLAKELSGMAHVVVEPNRPFSQRLQLEVNSLNVYGGVVGIYWPDAAGRRLFFRPYDYHKAADLRGDIFSAIRTSLVNRQPLYNCTWDSAKEALSRKIVSELKAVDSKEVDYYIEQFDQELASVKQNLASSEKEISRLKSEIRRYEAMSPPAVGLAINPGSEQEFYPREILSCIIDVLTDAKNNLGSDSRRRHLIESVINANPATNEAGSS